jgi:phosphopantetheine adenylyltransferase
MEKRANGRAKYEKRITITVDKRIDEIREKIQKETGVQMTYVQTFDYLIHHYLKENNAL